MSKFSLNKLAKSLAEKSGLSQMEAELFVRKMFDVCNQGLAQDKQVKIKWLGTFKILPVKDRESVDVNTGERILIEGRDKLSFTPDNILKEIINKPFAQFETVVVNDGVDFDIVDKMFDVEENDDDVEDELEDNLEETEAETDEKSEEPEVEVKTEEEPEEIIVLPATPILTEEQEKAEWRKAQEEKKKLEEEKALEEEQTAAEEETVAEDQIEEEETDVVEPKNDAESENASSSENISDEETVAMEDSANQRHVMIPRYLMIAVCLIFVVLISGIGWIAFNYGKLSAQRDRLVMELSEYRKVKTTTTKKKPNRLPQHTSAPETPEQTLKRKARRTASEWRKPVKPWKKLRSN